MRIFTFILKITLIILLLSGSAGWGDLSSVAKNKSILTKEDALRPMSEQNANWPDFISCFRTDGIPSTYTDLIITEKWSTRILDKTTGIIKVDIKFFAGHELVARSNVTINKEMAVVNLCDDFGVKPEYRSRGIGKEVVLRTFLGARKLADIYGKRLKWAVGLYNWFPEVEPVSPKIYASDAMQQFSRLFSSLGFVESLESDILLQSLSWSHGYGGHWARDLNEFCKENAIKSSSAGKKDGAAEFQKPETAKTPEWPKKVWAVINKIGLKNIRYTPSVIFARRLEDELGVYIGLLFKDELKEAGIFDAVTEGDSVFSITQYGYESLVEKIGKERLDYCGIVKPGVYILDVVYKLYIFEGVNIPIYSCIFHEVCECLADSEGDVDNMLHFFLRHSSYTVMEETLRFANEVGELTSVLEVWRLHFKLKTCVQQGIDDLKQRVTTILDNAEKGVFDSLTLTEPPSAVRRENAESSSAGTLSTVATEVLPSAHTAIGTIDAAA